MNKILVVENDSDLQAVLGEILSEHFCASVSYAVETTSDSRFALEKLYQDSTYKLILCDLAVGPIPGIELIMQLVVLYPEVPIVVMTGNFDDQKVLQALQLGAVDYLVKPADMPSLTVRTQAVLEACAGRSMNIAPPNINNDERVSQQNAREKLRQTALSRIHQVLGKA